MLAVNVRTNHVHAVISAACDPEPVLGALKAFATRNLRPTGLVSPTTKPWVRHGSTRYLWKEHHVEKAIAYVLYHLGGRTATAEGKIVDPKAKLYAHGSTTCLIFRAAA